MHVWRSCSGRGPWLVLTERNGMKACRLLKNHLHQPVELRNTGIDESIEAKQVGQFPRHGAIDTTGEPETLPLSQWDQASVTGGRTCGRRHWEIPVCNSGKTCRISRHCDHHLHQPVSCSCGRRTHLEYTPSERPYRTDLEDGSRR